MIRGAIFAIIACLCTLQAAAATKDLVPNVRIDARGEYQHVRQADTTVEHMSGFKGKLLSLSINGQITPKFEYSYRQRLNGVNKDHSFFDSTDWLWLKWHANDRFSLLAGKWAVLTGSWEMDPPPVDCFQLCEFAYGFPCYAWGLVGIYDTPSGHDQLMLQVCESPFRKMLEHMQHKDIDTYCYNLIWTGKHGPWHPLWGLNLVECMPGHFMTYLGLGNRFTLGSWGLLDVDFLNRAGSHQTYLFKDCSVMTRLEVRTCRHVVAFAKGSYDVNRSGTSQDLAVTDGTEIHRLGGGVLVYPLGDDRLRLHAEYSYAWGHNTAPGGMLQDRQHFINVGLTWKMQLLSNKK